MLADSLSLASKNLCQVIYFYAYVRLRLTFSLGPSESLGIFFADRGNTLHIRKQKKVSDASLCHRKRNSITILHGVITRGRQKRVDMRYPLKYDTTKKGMLNINDL